MFATEELFPKEKDTVRLYRQIFVVIIADVLMILTSKTDIIVIAEDVN